jgi:ATP-binding cassette, subfamily B, multidrug efflux pump
MKFRNYIAKSWYLYLIALAAMICSIGLDMVYPFITRSLIDDVIVGGNTQILMKLLFGLLGIGFGRAVFQFVKEFTFDYTSMSIGSKIRIGLFKHVQKLSIRFFDRNNTGELMARVKDDVDNIWNALGYVGMLAIECIIHTICVLVCMVSISPVLTIIPIVIMPIVAYTAVVLEKKIGKVYDDLSEENAALTTVVQENLTGVRVVKAFAREDYEIEKFRKHNKNYYDLSMKQSKISLKYNPNISFLTRLLLLLVVLVGGGFVIMDKISLGDLGAFTEYANNIIWPMEMIGWLSADMASGLASAKKIRKIWNEVPEIADKEGAGNLGRARGEVEFDNVSFNINDTQVLNNVSFKVPAGKTLGIMGVTGSGKTSIINLIERFYDATDGKVMLDGNDVKDITTQSLRENISVVMQDVFLFSDSIKENISIGRRDNITDELIESSAQSARAAGFIGKLSDKYETVVGERGVGLSGGQKQRISIARAIAKQAPVLILDDSTSALDMETEYEIQKELEAMKNTTKIIIAHRISAVKQADEIIVLEGGSIAERGTHDELMAKKGIYYDTYNAQYSASVVLEEVAGNVG